MLLQSLRSSNLRDPLLSPFQVALHFLRSSHTIGEICLKTCKSALCELLQFHELPSFGIELAGSVRKLSARMTQSAHLLTFAPVSRDCDPGELDCKHHAFGHPCNPSGRRSMHCRLTCRTRLSYLRSLLRSLLRNLLRSCRMGHRTAPKLCCSPSLREVTQPRCRMQHTVDLHTALASMA